MSKDTLPIMPGPGSTVEACWARSGVYGDSSCPELKQLVHCRNCAVYSAGALELLSRPAPPGYQQELTQQCSQTRQSRAVSRSSAVAFRLSSEWMALPTAAFQEIAEHRSIRSLPHRRQGILLGLANIRGEVLLCVSLGHFLGLEKLPVRDTLRRMYHRLLLVAHEGRRLAFPVDEVEGPLHLRPEQMLAPSATIARALPTYIQSLFRHQHRTIGLLEPNSLFEALNRSLA